MPTFNSKLPKVGTTIFTTMSQMATDYNAINLSQGYPDFPVPEALLTLFSKYLWQGENQYPPMIGIAYLRQEIMRKVKKLYHADVDMDAEITITSGATEAIFVAIQTIVHAGDEVIVFDPAYDCYEPAITLAGGKTVHIPLTFDGGHCIDWSLVATAITKNTRGIIINSPHNPTGSILSSSDLKCLAALIRDKPIYVISDEVYEHMVYDDQHHLSILGHEELRSKTFVISSFGKTYHATGWKIAYCIAPPMLSEEFRKIHQYVTFTTHTPCQWAIAEFMEHHAAHYLDLAAFYQAKRDYFLTLLEHSAFKLMPSAGTYFQLADYSAISDISDVEFANYLTQKVGVAAIPVSVFYEAEMDAKLVRFCFAKNNDTLARACGLLSELKAK